MGFWDAFAPLIAFYFLASALIPFTLPRLGPRAFILAAAVPALALTWTLAHTSAAFAPAADLTPEIYTWAPALGLEIAFRLDPLSWLMLVIINLVGALILLYCSGYFTRDSANLPQFAGAFLAFAAAMSGLVMSEHTMTLYLFWELTTFTSFLLIGHDSHLSKARAAARQAILVTTTGSLSMFAGFVILGVMPGGSFHLSELVAIIATAPASARLNMVWVTAGLVAVLVGAATKSALIPTHFWLPAAMAAPTPVSAFLHAAAMVKAGVYLIARLAPGFPAVPGISQFVVVLGLGTLLVGGYRSLKQTDLKLVLAYGTVSQLGLITVFLGFATPGTYLAGLAMIAAHAAFKSALFLYTGVIEKRTTTRDLTRLCGLGRRTRRGAAIAAAGVFAMTGIPLSGAYLAKEAGFTALLAAGGPSAGIVLFGVALGSALTIAYSLRYFWGAFAHKHGRDGNCPHEQKLRPVTRALQAVPGFLAVLSIVPGFFPGLFTRFLDLPANRAFTGPEVHLHWWSGAGPALLTAAVIIAGGALFYFRPAVSRAQRRFAVPKRYSAENFYEAIIRRLERYASRLTGIVQTGSLPVDLTVVFTIALGAGVAAALSGAEFPNVIHWADSPGQAIVALATIAATLLTVFSRRRLYAVLALSATGAGVVALFALHGAPDLALTQLVVEAVALVVFLLVLRRLPVMFSRRPRRSSNVFRAILAVAIGLGVVAFGLITSASRVHEPVSSLFPSEGAVFGGGNNLVNVVLVDVRAWDTVGELSVLLVAATGVTALIYLRALSGRLQRSGRKRRQRIRAEARQRRAERAAQLPETPKVWLTATSMLDPRRRSVVLEVSVRILFHTLLLVSIWLLFVGHNSPGGGFAGGMVAGIALMIRYFAGGRWELEVAASANPGTVMGVGLFVAVASALTPALFGHSVLQSTLFDLDLGPLGALHLSTAMGLDVGVYILVVGVVMDLLNALGAQIDRQGEAEGRQIPEINYDESPAQHAQAHAREAQEQAAVEAEIAAREARHAGTLEARRAGTLEARRTESPADPEVAR